MFDISVQGMLELIRTIPYEEKERGGKKGEKEEYNYLSEKRGGPITIHIFERTMKEGGRNYFVGAGKGWRKPWNKKKRKKDRRKGRWS